MDIAKHANLVNRFVTSCDFMGQYNLNAIPPSNLTFAVNNDIMQDLQGCRDNRNKREWFSYCKEICRNFQLTTYPTYFEPNIDIINSFTSYVNAQLDATAAARSLRPLFNAQSGQNKGSRVLEESGDGQFKKEHVRVLQESKTKVVFNTGPSARLNLATFKSDFLTSGVSLYDEGQSQLIKDDTYQSVKNFLDAKKSLSKKTNRNLGLGSSSSAGLWRIGSLLAVALLSLFKRG